MLIQVLALAFAIMNSPSFAALNFTQVEGASRVINSHNKFEIYAAKAGDPLCLNPNRDGTCNTCLNATEMTPCTRAAIRPQFPLTISLRSNTTTGAAILTLNDEVLAISKKSTRRNEVLTLSVPWTQLCRRMDHLSFDCHHAYRTGRSRVLARIGFDRNQNGRLDNGDEYREFPIEFHEFDHLNDSAFASAPTCSASAARHFSVCSYQITTNQSGFTVDKVTGHGPALKGPVGDIEKLRVYFSRQGFPQTPSEEFADFDLTSSATNDFSTEQRWVENLRPGPIYTRAGLVDSAGIEMFFTSLEAVNQICGSLKPDPSQCALTGVIGD